MKISRNILGILGLAMLIVFVGCSKAHVTDGQKPLPPNEGSGSAISDSAIDGDVPDGNVIDMHDTKNKPEKGLTMSIKQGSLSASDATLIFTNQTDNDFIYGSMFILEKKDGSAWAKVKPVIEDGGFTLEGYSLESKQSVESEVNWEWLYGRLPAGEYRIIKDFNQNGTNSRLSYDVAAEFKIE